MDKNMTYMVKNRSDGMVVYSIREDNIRREFQPGESKKVTFGELEKLSYQPGGRELIERYLQITNQEVTSTLNIETQPEYYMSAEDIKELLLHGSMAEFLDCLDFAPVGVLDLIKKMSVTLPLNDIEKRKAIKKVLGFNVDEAIRHAEEAKEDNNEQAEAPVRRVAQADVPAGRRTAPKYKVTSIKE